MWMWKFEDVDALRARAEAAEAEVERLRAAIVDQWVPGGDYQCSTCLSYADTREAVEHDPTCIMVTASGEGRED
jgi:hypothetical protein